MANGPVPGRDNLSNRAAPSANKYDLTMVNFGGPVDEDEDRPVQQSIPLPPPPQGYSQYQQAPPQHPHQTAQGTQVNQPQQPAKSRKGIPIWVWLLVAFFLFILLLAAGVGAYFLIPRDGFTLRVLNAPSGAKVYVDDIPSGVPQRDGTIIVQGLRTGEARDLRVSEEGYADWKTTVTGQPGKVVDVTVNLTPLQTKTTPSTGGLPAEIDFSGRMALIPAGEFKMGADDSNPEEAPAHPVTLPDYYIDKYEVTNEQYGNFCNATNHPKPVNPFWDPQYFEKNPRMPVIGVSYSDAQAYAQWANKRLPTESEWEKAASWSAGATAKHRYPWGDTADKRRSNVESAHPSNIGQFAEGASGYGVLDMAGNAREWVDGTFEAYPGSKASNPQFGRGLKVVRGGDFRAGLPFAKTTSRLGVESGFKTNPGDDKVGRSSLVGIRCAISADDSKLQTVLKPGGN